LKHGLHGRGLPGEEEQEGGLPRGSIAAIAVCSLGGTAFGYDLGAVSAATRGWLHAFQLSVPQLGVTVSASLWGGAAGSLLAGKLAHRCGRRPVLAGSAILYALAAIGLALVPAGRWPLLLLLRVLSGVAIGGFVVDCPLYLAEISPRAWRGRVVGCFQLQIGAGVVLAFTAGALLSMLWPGPSLWRWFMALGALPPLCLLALLRWVPEEPHWLHAAGRPGQAERSAARLGIDPAEWLRSQNLLRGHAAPGSERLLQRKYLRPILLAISIAMFNQLSGVQIFRMYLLDLLSSAGMGHRSRDLYAVSISVLSLAVTLTAVMLIDLRGRKPLLLAGSAGMGLCLVSLTLALRGHAHPGTLETILTAFNACFAFSQGPMVWIYLSELFPFAVRGAGQGLGSLVHWLTSASVILCFPLLQRAAPSGVFLIFAAIMLLQVAIVARWYPETKGTPLGQLAREAIVS
jgi:sugar porter (SP) family MFS transporter